MRELAPLDVSEQPLGKEDLFQDRDHGKEAWEMIMSEDIRMMQKDKLCYVCSPYRENGERTVKLHEWYAKWLCDYIAINYGYTPIAPHLIYPSIWNESDPEGRQRGMECGEEILKKCDIIAVGRDYGISEGMKSEIELAKSLGKEVVIFEMHNFLVDGIHEAETRNTMTVAMEAITVSH